MLICCYCITVALSAVKDVAGNISVKNIQDLQEGVSKLHDQFGSDDKPEEEDKKDQWIDSLLILLE